MKEAPPLSILMSVDAVGGVWRYAMTLARALGPARARIHLASLGGGIDAAERAEVAALPHVSLHAVPFRLEWMEACEEDVAASGDWLLALARELQPDIVHLNGYAHAALDFGAPCLVVAHSDVCSWWRAVHGVAAPASWDGYRARLRAGLDGADLVIAPTSAMADALIREHGPVDRLAIIHNGIDLAAFGPRPKRERVLGAGRVWDEAKNLRALDRAAASLPWPVEIAGPLCFAGEAVALAHATALGSLAQPELAVRLGEAAIFAAPARYEPYGLAVAEAAAAGCALVLGDIASLRELWGEAALFVAPDDCEALINAIRLLIVLPAQRTELALRAHARAHRLTAATMAVSYLAEYRALLGRHRAAAE